MLSHIQHQLGMHIVMSNDWTSVESPSERLIVLERRVV